MGVIEFFLLCILVCVLAAAAVWAIGYFAPGTPAIVPKIIWGVAIIIIVVALMRALGVVDVPMPRLR